MINGRKILVTCVDETYYNSLGADTTEIFDEIRIYTEATIPMHATETYNHLNYPMTLLEVMGEMGDDDILIYSKSSIPVKKKLKKWLNIVAKNSAIFFFHGDTVDGITEMFMHDLYYKAKLLPFYRLDDELFLLRKSSQYLIEEWSDRIAYNQKTNNEEHANEGAILNNIIYNNLGDNKIQLVFMD